MFKTVSKERKINNFFMYFGEYLVSISQIAFRVSVITFVVFVLLEYFKTGLISNYFDINCLLILSIISGLIVVLFNNKKYDSRS